MSPTNSLISGQHEPLMLFDLQKNALVYPLLSMDGPDIQRGGCLVGGIEHPLSRQSRAREKQSFTSADIEAWDLRSRRKPERIKGIWLYAGPIYKHFGHCMAESFHRLWPLMANSKLTLNGLLFLGENNECDYTNNQLLDYQREVIDHFKMASFELKICTKPFLVDRLLIASQASTLGPLSEPCDQYIEILTNYNPLPKKEFCNKNFYVSRTKLSSTSRLIGEKLLEKKLKEFGYQIIYPESISLKQQLEIYASADRLVFCEGSAVHGLEVLGKIKARVDLISRGGLRSKRLKTMQSVLRKRSSGLVIHDKITRHPPLTCMKNALGELVPCHWNIGVWFEFKDFLDLLSCLNGDNSFNLNPEQYRDYMLAEFLDYVLALGVSDIYQIGRESFDGSWLKTKSLIKTSLQIDE